MFFYAAPLLVIAIYGYFHLYQIRLWDELGAANSRIDGKKLGDAIAPWLVSDAALLLRLRLRDDYCATLRTMEWPNALWNIFFTWIAGPIILFWLWWASMPARDWLMSGVAGASLIGSSIFGVSSAVMIWRRMSKPALQSFLAQLQDSDLTYAQMQNAWLFGSVLNGAQLTGAQLQGTDLSWVHMQEVNLRNTQMQGSVLDGSLIEDAGQTIVWLSDTNFEASINNGGALRKVNFLEPQFDNETDWRNVFLDSSVSVSDEFRTQMGNPCQWANERLPDKMFFGRWRGWVEANPTYVESLGWPNFAPKQWRRVKPIPPPENCFWKTGPLPE